MAVDYFTEAYCHSCCKLPFLSSGKSYSPSVVLRQCVKQAGNYLGMSDASFCFSAVTLRAYMWPIHNYSSLLPAHTSTTGTDACVMQAHSIM